MIPQADRNYTAFADHKIIATGQIFQVAKKVKEYLAINKSSVLIFDDITSSQIEIDLRGNLETVLLRLDKQLTPKPDRTGPGRPKLGVVSKEITLLPQHWEWLAAQPGGASVTLRKLVEVERKKNSRKDQLRIAQESIYKFMYTLTGNMPYYEDALRALYALDKKTFELKINSWPSDIKKHLRKLAENVF